MTEFVLDADSNSWGSDFEQGDDYASDYSDNEFLPSGVVSSSAHHAPGAGAHRAGAGEAAAALPLRTSVVKSKNNVNARKMVNRGRWTKDEVSPLLKKKKLKKKKICLKKKSKLIENLT